jgi:Putative Ig domain/Domain of unknown function (DUF5666)
MPRSSMLFNVLAAAGLVGLLSGCGGGGSSSPATGSTSGSAAASGTVTGFGSVFVNGKRFEANDVEVRHDGITERCTVNPTTTCGLKQGMTVTVTGSFDGNKWVAGTLVQKDAVEGLVQSIAADGSSLVVMGRTVLVDRGTLIDNNISGQNILSLLVGKDSVEVNGYIRPTGEIQATFIEKKAVGTVTPEVRGFAKNHDAGTKTFQIGGLNVVYDNNTITIDMPNPTGNAWNGLFVEVKGTNFDSATTTLIATKIEPENQVVQQADEFEVEGFVTQVVGPGNFFIGTTHVQTTPSTEFRGGTIDEIVEGVKLSVDGELANGILTATHVATNAAPVITSTPTLVGTQGVAYSYDVDATDANGDTLTYSLVEPAPFGMTINPATGVISWTPAAQVGDNPVTVQVSDGSLAGSQSFTVTVAVVAAPAAPVFITPTTLPPAFEQTLYTTTINATDANGDTLTYSLVAPIPAGMTPNSINSSTGVISWTAAAGQVGPIAVTVQARDNSSSSLATSQTFTINVNAATAACGVTFGFDDLTRGGFNVTQPGIWTNEGPNAFSTLSGSAIIVRRDLEVEIHNGSPRFIQPELTFLGVTLINRGTSDTTFAIAGYTGSHGVTAFYYTVTIKVGGPSVTVLNSIPDNSNRPMNVPVERLEVNGVSLSPSDFGVSSLAVGTAGGAPPCP